VAPDPAPLMALATGYWGSRAFHTALDLGVFEILGDEAVDATALARRLGLNEHPARMLLNALTGLQLLEQCDGEFRLAPLARAFLIPGSAAYLGDALAYAGDMYQAWGSLASALRADAPVVTNDEYLGEDRDRTRRFVRSMHARALGVGQALVSLLDLDGCDSLLDLGGGPGSYSALLVRRYPRLRATVMELPAVAAMAREILEEMEVQDRVAVVSGDIHRQPLPAPQDAVLISGVLHRERAAAAKTLIRRAHDCLRPGGQLIVSDVFTDAGGATPAFAALFGLNMLLSAPGGGVHSDAEVMTWMHEASLQAVTVSPFPPPMPHRVVIGRRGPS
jgi:SAM-dependent methyltransferase